MTTAQQAITWPDVERHPAKRTTDPDTSVEPSEFRMSKGRWAALHALYEYGPQTDFELGERTGMPQTGAGKRRLELQRAGLVERTEDRRPSPNGSLAIVWALTDKGVEFHREGMK